MQADASRRPRPAPLNLAELFEFMRAQWGSVSPDYSILFDAREMTVDQTSADVRQIVAEVSRRDKEPRLGAPVAMVVAADHVFSLGRLYEMLLENAGVMHARVFRSTSEAEEWLSQR